MRHVLLALCLLPATGCLGKSPAAPGPVDREVLVAQGQTVELTSGLTVGFVSVIGDSRCPIDGICIQGGDAIVRIDIATGQARGQRDLHTGSMEPVTFEGVQVRLVELTPYPFSGRTTEQKDYRATLRVVR